MNEPQYGWWLPPDVSVHGGEIDFTINMLHWFMLVLFVGWSGFIVYCLVRFRERPDHVATYKPIPARAYSGLVVGVAIAEAILLIVIDGPAWAKIKTEFPQQDPVVIRAVAEQFKWLFHYPGQDGVFGRTGPEFYADDNPAGLDFDDDAGIDDITVRGLHFPMGRSVIVRLNSKDVIHSFKMPVMRVTQDAIPGMEIPVWFEAKATGKFQLGCAQLCGLGHYEMKADLIIQTQEEYQAWLDEEHAYLGLDE